MYRVKFLERIETKGTQAVKSYHTVDYGELAITKRAAHFKSMGFIGVVSVKCGEGAKLSPAEVLDLYYPEKQVVGGTEVLITDEDNEIKEAALKASKGEPKKEVGPEDKDELKALRAEAKAVGIKNGHVMGKAKLIEKIAETKK